MISKLEKKFRGRYRLNNAFKKKLNFKTQKKKRQINRTN